MGQLQQRLYGSQSKIFTICSLQEKFANPWDRPTLGLRHLICVIKQVSWPLWSPFFLSYLRVMIYTTCRCLGWCLEQHRMVFCHLSFPCLFLCNCWRHQANRCWQSFNLQRRQTKSYLGCKDQSWASGPILVKVIFGQYLDFLLFFFQQRWKWILTHLHLPLFLLYSWETLDQKESVF